jgi:hypothetical protein
MSIDKKIKKTTIDFPRPIDFENSKKLLCYIADNLPADVSWNIEYSGSFTHDTDVKGLVEDKGELRVNALIQSLRTFDTLTSKPFDKGTSLISALESSGQIEYNSEVRKFWDDVRKCVEKYFEENKPNKNS